MKKLLLLIVLATTCLAAQAQKNQVSLSFGISFDTLLGAGEDYYYSYVNSNTLQGLYGTSLKYSGGALFSLEYLRELSERLNVGCEFHYGMSSITRTPGAAYKDDPQHYSSYRYALTPVVRYDYVEGAQCTLYLKADVGAGFETSPIEDTKLRLEYQFYPLALQINGRYINVFGEMGFGTLYYVRWGVGRKF